MMIAGVKNSDISLAKIPEDHELNMNEHMKAMWAGQSNVIVAVRVRPLMKHDVVKKSCVKVLNGKVIVIFDPAAGDKQDVLRANRSKEKQYAFDFVFEPGSSQEFIYNNTTKFLIHGVLDGYNATVFAYGQTGSGKTHTMIGSEQEPGIMVRVMEDLFVHSHKEGSKHGVQYKVTVSFLEVYNENIRDLLSDVEEYLDLREDPIKGPVVASITEIEASSGKEIMQLLHQGNSRRSQAPTAANEVSSRSHAVLQVVVECRDRAPGTVANIKVGKLSLVDLAGSERAANTKNVGQRLVEGANINRSLLALGNCINALGEKGNKGNFVPYRDSKLTRLLKDSLGGNCRTVMIANISCAESSFEETLNTLKYANRAKNIKTNVQRNVLNVNYHISEYVELINNLRGEIQLLKNQIGSSSAASSSTVTTSNQFNRGDFSGIPNQRLLSPQHPSNNCGGIAIQPSPYVPNRHEPSTPFQALRESLKSGPLGEGRELVNNMRQKIVENFQERMQLRRSLIELEDQNVQNSIEVSKRQLLVVQWSEKYGNSLKPMNLTKNDFAAFIMADGTPEIIEAWQECEQLRKAIIKNNGMKKNIAKRLRHNEKEAENFREELGDNITGEDRRELMALQYQVGRLELENMELEQHRIVHESILKGKDLVIQKLKLQLAVRDKLINRQQLILKDNHLDHKVGYDQLALLEETLLMSDHELAMPPPSPPRSMADILDIGNKVEKVSSEDSATEESSFERRGGPKKKSSKHKKNFVKNKPVVPKLSIKSHQSNLVNSNLDEEFVEEENEIIVYTERESAITSRDRDFVEQGDWSEIQSELFDQSFSQISSNVSNGQLGAGSVNQISNARHHRKSQRKSGVANAANNVQSTPVSSSSVKEKGVNGPKGGKIYRSPIYEEVSVSKLKQPQKHSVIDEFVASDDDSITQQFQSKFRHYYSPRNAPKLGVNGSFEKLEPIQSIEEANVGILSGRNKAAENTPRNNQENAAVYPVSLVITSTKKDKNEGFVGVSNPRNYISNSKKEDFESQRERIRHNSKSNIDDENIDLSNNDDGALVIRSKPLGNKPFLNKIKSRHNSSVAAITSNNSNGQPAMDSGAAADINPSSDLNVYGNAIESVNSSNINAARPPNNRVKPSGRGVKVNQKLASPTAFDNDAVIPNDNNDQYALGVRMRSLPTLNKQQSGNMPVSARGEGGVVKL